MDDPSGAPRPLFTDAEIKSYLNVWYLTLREEARFVGEGSALKIAYDTAADGTIEYAMPVDFIRLRSTEIDLDGGDLSALAPNAARIKVLEEIDYVQAWQSYQLETLTTISTVSLRDRFIAILSPPDSTAAGTNSIRFVYEASTAELSGDTDEPTLARPHHPTIARMAAVNMLATKGLQNSTLSALASSGHAKFLQAASDEIWAPNSSAWVAGLDDQDSHSQRSGSIDW